MDYNSIDEKTRMTVIDVLEGGLRAAQKALGEVDRLQKDIDSGLLGQKTINEYKRQQDRIRHKELDEIRKKTLDAALSLIDEAENEIRQSALPKASEITDDVYLLNSEIKLTEEELSLLFKKPENQSSTMKRLFLRYYEENGLEPPLELRIWSDGSKESLVTLASYRAAAKQLCREDFIGSPTKGHFQSPAAALRLNLVRRAFLAD